MSGKCITVCGPIESGDLGVTLPHEHLLIDFSCRYTPASDEASIGPQPALEDRWRLLRTPAGYKANLDGTSIESAVREANWFKDAGGRTIVDLTGVGLGADVAGLKEISEATGLNVVAASGLYIDQSLPEWVHGAELSEENLEYLL